MIYGCFPFPFQPSCAVVGYQHLSQQGRQFTLQAGEGRLAPSMLAARYGG